MNRFFMDYCKSNFPIMPGKYLDSGDIYFSPMFWSSYLCRYSQSGIKSVSSSVERLLVQSVCSDAVFLSQEDPYIMLDQPTACTATKGTICQMVADSELGKHSISTLNNLFWKFVQKIHFSIYFHFKKTFEWVFLTQLMSTEQKKSEIQTQQYSSAAPVSVLICWGNSPMISHSTLLLNEWKMEPGEELWMAAGTDL